MTTYAKKLRDPRWQYKRLTIAKRDNFQCQKCSNYNLMSYIDTDKIKGFELLIKGFLHIHHEKYIGKNPWDTPDEYLITLCLDCHEQEHLRITAETNRNPSGLNHIIEVFKKALS